MLQRVRETECLHNSGLSVLDLYSTFSRIHSSLHGGFFSHFLLKNNPINLHYLREIAESTWTLVVSVLSPTFWSLYLIGSSSVHSCMTCLFCTDRKPRVTVFSFRRPKLSIYKIYWDYYFLFIVLSCFFVGNDL